MSWRLILSLSLFGVAMGVASIFGLTKDLEPILWALIGIFSAIWIARRAPGKYFLHGLLTGLIGGSIAPLIQALFFSTYIANNPLAAENLRQLPAGFSARTFFFILVLVIGVLTGLVLGTLSWIAGKIARRHA